MKILHVLNTNHFSGAENVVCQIIGFFSDDCKYEMVYCSPDGPIREALKERGIEYRCLDSLSRKELKKAIKEVKPDIIHAHDMKASFVASLVCGKIPLVSHIHNNAFDSRSFSLKSVAFLYAGIKARHIFWVSESSFKNYLFKKFFVKKSSVLYNIIDIASVIRRTELDNNNYSFDVIYLGRLSNEKNPLRFVDICRILAEKKDNIKIAIVGDGNLHEKVVKRIEEYNISKNVKVFGFVNNPSKILKCSKIMLMTSLWEGTPMAALEAAVLGTPIVSTPVDGLKDLIRNDYTGFLSNDNNEIAERIIHYLSDSTLLKKMSVNQINESKKWNDKKVYKEKLLDVYNDF